MMKKLLNRWLILAVLLCYEGAIADPNIYTKNAVGGSGSTSFPATVTGGTSGGIPYFSATTTLSSSALLGVNAVVLGGGAGAAPYTDITNLVYSAVSGPRLTIGSSGTSTGWTLGYYGTSGNAAFWNSAQTLSNSNYALYQDVVGNTAINGASGREVDIGVNNGAILIVKAAGMQSSSPVGGTSKLFYGATAPTLASGGCTSPTAVTSNGTFRFSVGVGTGCSGSQPLVFTLPAATAGWNCYAQNSSNAASIQPAQSSAVSTTSVTITAYSRTLGTAAAWVDGDVVVVSCLGG